MLIEALLQKGVQQFIKENELSDPFSLSIKHRDINGVPIAEIANQIKGLKSAKVKLPSWYAEENIIYPQSISMEQCSSETTATYKASLVNGKNFIDLTGGAGVDTWALSKKFERGVYVERQPDLAKITQHNLEALKVIHIDFNVGEAIQILEKSEEVFDLIYLDPARRDSANKKVFQLADCEPDVTQILPFLLKKGKKLMIKTSPMLDISLTLKDLRLVSEVHVVAVKNECKEVLYLLENNKENQTNIKTINFDTNRVDNFSFYLVDEQKISASLSYPHQYLYEPNVAILKAGAFNTIAEHYGVSKLHIHTHLYTSKALVPYFPGRIFEISAVCGYDKKSIQNLIPEGKANITTRNFKDDVAAIRKKTGLKDGGDTYVFACLNMDNRPILIVGKKVN